jgi:hypothetical protein
MGVGGAVAAPAAKPSIRVGVYDSRGVTMAYARSSGFRESMNRLRGDYEEAKAQGDSTQAKKREQQGQWMQVRLHRRGFSTAGAGDLLAKVADGLPGVAREAGVVLIVSKWEMPFKDPAVEIDEWSFRLVPLAAVSRHLDRRRSGHPRVRAGAVVPVGLHRPERPRHLRPGHPARAGLAQGPG